MSTKASNFFQASPLPTASIVGQGVMCQFGSGAWGFHGANYGGGSTADDDWHTKINLTSSSGYLLYLASIVGTSGYTVGDSIQIRLTIDGVVWTPALWIASGNNRGQILVGSKITYDGTNYTPVENGRLRFNDSLLVEQQVIRAGATSMPSLRVTYELE